MRRPNPRWIDIVFETNDLAGRFDAVLSAADEPVPGKPEPDLYERMAERLGVDPAEMVIVEDSSNGVAAAAASGAYVDRIATLVRENVRRIEEGESLANRVV